MSSYRTAYENYYKNINNTSKGKKDKNNNKLIGKKADNYLGPRYGNRIKSNEPFSNIIIKRVTRELTGATILLFFFVGLKYVPSDQVSGMHIKCKQLLNHNFNYNEYIEAFNSMQIGNIKGKDLKVGNFTTEDLKIENLKIKAQNFVEYLKNNNDGISE